MRLSHAFLLVFLGLCTSTTGQNSILSDGNWIDLSYAYDENTVFWPTAENFELETVYEGTTEGGYFYSAYQFCLAEHGGTHMDAPVHFAKGKWTVDQVPLEQTIGPAVVIDVSQRALLNPDYLISIEDVQKWERQHGEIPDESILLFRTGYGKFWPDRAKYMGTDERGAEAVAKLHFPGIGPTLAEWLVNSRSIKAVGLDTPSLDYGQSKLFRSHQILNGANIPGFENLANLDKLPPTGAYVIALPMKIKGGSGGPLRIIALVD